MKNFKMLSCLLFLLFDAYIVKGQITQIWLTFNSNEPSHIVVNWKSNELGDSEVYYRIENGHEHYIIKEGKSKLHHVEIPMEKQDVVYHYRVVTNQEKSKTFTFKGLPSKKKEFRVAIVGNWGYADHLDLLHLKQDSPHLLMTVGDNIPKLNNKCGSGIKNCIKPYLELIDSYPELFQTTPFLPVLGNHDKQIRERGNKYPSQAVYDTNATAFRKFFELPDDEWKWHFNVPAFKVCFIALDLNHVTDYGTTWQACHNFHFNSEQMNWYQKNLKNNHDKTIITLMNAKNQRMRNREDGLWQKMFQKGTAVISGYGYYSERAGIDGFPYFNTSLKKGDIYPDNFSKFLRDVNGYILLTFRGSRLKVEMKIINGKIIDRSFW